MGKVIEIRGKTYDTEGFAPSDKELKEFFNRLPLYKNMAPKEREVAIKADVREWQRLTKKTDKKSVDSELHIKE